MKISNKRLILSGGVAFVSILLLLGVAGVRYVHAKTPDTGVMAAYARWFGLSAGKAGDVRVSYAQYLRHLSAERTFLASSLATDLPKLTAEQEKKRAFDRAMRVAAVHDLAKQEAVVIPHQVLDDAYAAFLVDFASSTRVEASSVKQVLERDLGWSEAEFRAQVLEPALMEDRLTSDVFVSRGGEESLQAEIDRRISGDLSVRKLRLP